MKKLLALLLALVMVFALCACGGTDEEKNETKESKTVSDAEETEDTKPATYNYVVTVVNEEGNPVSGVRVKMNASGATSMTLRAIRSCASSNPSISYKASYSGRR